MKSMKELEDGYACGLVLKTADFSVHVPLQPQSSLQVWIEITYLLAHLCLGVTLAAQRVGLAMAIRLLTQDML